MPHPNSMLLSQGEGALSAMRTIVNAGGYTLVGEILVDGAASIVELSDDIKNAAKNIAENLII